MSGSRATGAPFLITLIEYRRPICSGLWCAQLVFVEFRETMSDAIFREKRIEKWLRA